VVILYSNHKGRPPLFPTAGPRQPEMTTPTSPIFPPGGFRPLAFQFAAADIPSSSTPPMFQPAFDATTEDQLGWDQMGTTTFSRPWMSRNRSRRLPVTVDTGTSWDSTDTATGRSDPAGRRSDTGERSDNRRRSDTGCCRFVAGGHGDIVSRPARTAGGQGT
jgi:hypothetical protein